MNIINKLIKKLADRQREVIQNTDPERITVEEVAKFFFLPKWYAKLIFKVGIIEGTFEKNPDGTYKYLGK